MAIIVSASFNQPNNPTSLGTADTGQVWVPYDSLWTPGDLRWQILNNQAARECGGNPSVGDGGYALVNAGFRNSIVRVTINNPAFGGGLNNANFGMVFRWASVNDYWIATWSAAGQFLRICQVVSGVNVCTNEGFPGPEPIEAGEVLEIHLCDDLVQGYFRNALVVTTSPVFGAGVLGTYYGLQCGNGVINDTAFALFDNFTVETNDVCPSSPSVSASPSPTPSASPSSSPSASPEPCTPPIGRAISCVNARGRLFVTLANDDSTSQVAFAWHEGAERMPITSMTNWKRSLRALTLQEMDIAFETDNLDENAPLIVSVHRNLRRNYVRDARVNSGSSRIDSLSAQFDADHIGDEIAIFGHNIGGPGIDFLIGRIAALASPSASPSPSASLSASPSATFSPSPSGSPSASPSSSRSGSPSPSHSPSSSPSASPSRSGSASPSVTASASPSASPSSSPSSSQSASPSAS